LRLVSWNNVVLHDLSGQPTGTASIGEDITVRKRTELDLVKAKLAAEEANHAKSKFLTNMSHELRTPMAGIIGMTDLALDSDLTAEQRECLEAIKYSADALLSIISNILDFSKIEAGKYDLELSEFDLGHIFKMIVKGLQERALQKGLRLTSSIHPLVKLKLIGDPGRLRQVLVNLVGNAIKFTDRGEINMYVEPVSYFEDQAELLFSVCDTGIGIPPEMQKLIFEEFVQVDDSPSRKFGGTGLGLAIASQIIKLFGGKIWVESEPGKGSTFSFTACFSVPQSLCGEKA
jgi:signal transduction histidine kinase